MKRILKNIRIAVQDQDALEQVIARKLSISFLAQVRLRILRRAIDTRHKNQPFFEYTVLINCSEAFSHHDLIPYEETIPPINPLIQLSDPNPFIIGMGPAGLFCALALVEQGFQPWIFDQGDSIESRSVKVEHFWQSGELDAESNVQFGEGGAGAFSDGKLTSRARDPVVGRVYELLTGFGASESITYEAHPHLGTEVIRCIVMKIRIYLQERGCRFYYRHKLTDIKLAGDMISGIRINGELHTPSTVFLATGNSARSLWKAINQRGISLEAKPFAIGFRIEHPQDYLDRSIYGSEKWADIIGAASYRLTDATSGSFTFCMCPGGEVIAAASSAGELVTNGMSYSRRGGRYGNSAVVTQIHNHHDKQDVFGGVDFQQQIEISSYNTGFSAPVQRAVDYIQGRASSQHISCTYKPLTHLCDLNNLFPVYINRALKSALQKFDGIYRGFVREGTVIAPETRTSSPVRILRDELTRSSVTASNLYPIGEGSGYAGGIISSAADGYRTGKIFVPDLIKIDKGI